MGFFEIRVGAVSPIDLQNMDLAGKTSKASMPPLAENSEITATKRRRGPGRPFQPGQSGNPGGRPLRRSVRPSTSGELNLGLHPKQWIAFESQATEILYGGAAAAWPHAVCAERPGQVLSTPGQP
jgi:hypothetical protein